MTDPPTSRPQDPEPEWREPAEDELPDKPPIEDMPSGDDDPPTDQEEHEVDVGEFLSEEDAAADETVDDAEEPQRIRK